MRETQLIIFPEYGMIVSSDRSGEADLHDRGLRQMIFRNGEGYETA